MALIGNLSTMPLPDLLQWLATAGKSGSLQVERNRIKKWIEMRNGRLVGCSSDDRPELLGQYLLSRGKLSADQLREALVRQEQTGQHLGRTLVEMELLTHDDLVGHLEAKAEETIYSLFDWTEGVFRFEDGQGARPSTYPVDLQVEDVLLRGLKRFDEMQRIRQVFHDPGIVLRYTAKPPGPEIFSNKMARSMYATIDGDRTVADIVLQVHGSEYLVYKFLFELHRNGYVEIAGIHSLPDAPDAAATAEPAHEASTIHVPETLGDLEPIGTGLGGTSDVLEATAVKEPATAVATGVGELPAEVEGDLARVRQLMSEEHFEEALGILDVLYQRNPNDDSLRRLSAEAEAAFVDKAYRHYLPPEKVPVLSRPVESLASETLTPHDFFLLSRIDGTWDIKSIIQIAPLREVDALRTLKRMREEMIELRDAEPY